MCRGVEVESRRAQPAGGDVEEEGDDKHVAMMIATARFACVLI